MSFDSLGLRAELLRAVQEQDYLTPTPVQLQAIPAILAGRDLMAAAQTGTGKTAGFTLPMLQRLLEAPSDDPNARRNVRALILVPTRELCAQVAESVRVYGRHLPLRGTQIFGGVGMQPQIDALRRGVDIVIATPGRLLDHVQRRTINLSHVEILVLDEADRMLDMGFIAPIKRILSLLPGKRQNLLFSATFADEIRELADRLLDSPEMIDVTPRNKPVDLIEQVVYHVDAAQKPDAIAHLFQSKGWSQALVFTRTKHGADRLAKRLLKAGISADAIHGNKSQNQRTRALATFKEGKICALVATDIAARGLDIDGLPQVVNFELPHVPEDYVHRIGRTGRAGAIGHAVSLVSRDEIRQLRAIERVIGRALDAEVVEGFEPLHGIPAPSREGRAGGQNRPRRGSPRGADTRGPDTRGPDDRGQNSRGTESRGGDSRPSQRRAPREVFEDDNNDLADEDSRGNTEPMVRDPQQPRRNSNAPAAARSPGELWPVMRTARLPEESSGAENFDEIDEEDDARGNREPSPQSNAPRAGGSRPGERAGGRGRDGRRGGGARNAPPPGVMATRSGETGWTAPAGRAPGGGGGRGGYPNRGTGQPPRQGSGQGAGQPRIPGQARRSDGAPPRGNAEADSGFSRKRYGYPDERGNRAAGTEPRRYGAPSAAGPRRSGGSGGGRTGGTGRGGYAGRSDDAPRLESRTYGPATAAYTAGGAVPPPRRDPTIRVVSRRSTLSAAAATERAGQADGAGPNVGNAGRDKSSSDE